METIFEKMAEDMRVKQFQVKKILNADGIGADCNAVIASAESIAHVNTVST